MSKGCLRMFRVRIGRCLVGAPSMLTRQWSPSARLARNVLISGFWGRAPQGARWRELKSDLAVDMEVAPPSVSVASVGGRSPVLAGIRPAIAGRGRHSGTARSRATWG
jgi:hypothetical protein